MKTDEKLAESQEQESAKTEESAEGKESKGTGQGGGAMQNEEAGDRQTEAQKTNQTQDTAASIAATILATFAVIMVVLVVVFANWPKSSKDDFEARLAACEEACGLTEPKDDDAQTKSGATQAPERDAKSSEKAAGKDSDKQKSQTKGDEAQKATTGPSSPSPSPKAKETKPEPVETLSPDQLTYFCNILGVYRNGSKDPKKWESPRVCADVWYLSDESDYYDEWLVAAAHPKLSAELLHYLAYRCDSNYISEEENAEKLAKLVLAHKKCDSDCIEYLSSSDYNAVREAVYAKLLG